MAEVNARALRALYQGARERERERERELAERERRCQQYIGEIDAANRAAEYWAAKYDALAKILAELDSQREQELTDYDALADRYAELQSAYDKQEDAYNAVRLERIRLIIDLTQAQRIIRKQEELAS